MAAEDPSASVERGTAGAGPGVQAEPAVPGEEDRGAQVWEALREVVDPELGVNVVDLGLIYGVYVGEGGYVEVTMTATTPGCPLQALLGQEVQRALTSLPWARRPFVHWVWSPPWTPNRMTAAGRQQLGWG